MSILSHSNTNYVETGLVEELTVIRERLNRNDPEFRHLELFRNGSTYTSLLLEHSDVQESLDACFRECIGNSHVTCLTLTALPQADLRFGLEKTQALQALQTLIVQHTARSQSLCATLLQRVLRAHMPIPSLLRPGLVKLSLDIRIVVHTQDQMDALAVALSHQTNLEHVSLHILPRCSIQNPTLSLHSVVQVLANLPRVKVIQLTAGYDHNPYRRPMIRNVQVLQQLLNRTNSTLERLQLDNFGLRDEHLRAITSCLAATTSKLRHLQLARNHAHQFSVPAVQELCRAVAANVATTTTAHHQQPCCRLESCVLWTTDECRRAANSAGSAGTTATSPSIVRMLLLEQEHMHMHCLLNKLGRKPRTKAEWWNVIGKASTYGAMPAVVAPPASVLLGMYNGDGSGVSEESSSAALAVDRTALGAVYTLIRSNPALIVASENTAAAYSNTSNITASTATTAVGQQPQKMTRTLEEEFKYISSPLFATTPGYSLRTRHINKKRAAVKLCSPTPASTVSTTSSGSSKDTARNLGWKRHSTGSLSSNN